MDEKKKQIVERVLALLARKRGAAPDLVSVGRLAGDGSSRIFYRFQLAGQDSLVAVVPPGSDMEKGRAEAASAWHIARHLWARGVPVPRPLARDEETGLLLFEDLGDMRLQELVQAGEHGSDAAVFALYRDVIRELARMQVRGREGFEPSWCWQTRRYDRRLMLERESGYFLQAFCRDFCRLSPDVHRLRREFELIADRAAAAPADFFLHRDFQSRNIMIRDGRVRIIDFQGGRLGPLAYDLASLLIDPYVCLSTSLQERLFGEYLNTLARYTDYDPEQFAGEYVFLALQRNLQVLGAFAFLGGRRGKTFFLAFLEPALSSLEGLLVRAGTNTFPELNLILQRSRFCLEEICGKA